MSVLGRLDQGKVRACQVKTEQDRCGQVWSDEVRPGQNKVRSGHVRSDLIRFISDQENVMIRQVRSD